MTSAVDLGHKATKQTNNQVGTFENTLSGSNLTSFYTTESSMQSIEGQLHF